ncbi:ABC transporter substrate-binding protein [Paenibacillus sp. TRM 82003]|uniref:ABC transporter substrate-binding protein n=1 Tax=Kineococcus sp. TRM81007 TaxID=2925831 RepID=UPI001F567ABE|nr:ABC transporter substrate-binding protein [Kineococcus sp. TRM81007]MCI2237754.1 ABC transporter substrate-binding protein [Kineococcus sp. TRM81007]MCI3921772.1 ABC transporter substrate-binding protein [Paenibacillus sp. TRM 82003]
MKRRTFIAATGTTAAVTGLAACAGGDGEGSGSGTSGTLTLATVAAPQPWDLTEAGLGNNAIYYQPVYDPLLRLTADAELTENLATDWSYDETGTVLTLTLREGVTFTDGTVFDAEAVKANLEHTRTGSNEASTNIASISSVDVVDPQTVAITLSAPDPSLLTNLANVSGMMVSPQAIGTPELATTPVGSGPYVLSSSGTTAGSQYTFTRNPDYWNAEAFGFDTVVLRYMSDPTALVNALRSGQIDGGQLTDHRNAAPLEGADDLTVTEYVTGDVDGLYIWDRAGTVVPALADVRVRQALNHAMDRATIIETAKGGLGDPTTQVFNPESTAYDATLDDVYPYDVARAKELLAEAGYADGFDVAMPDFSAFFPTAQAALTEALEAIGVRPAYETVPPDQLINELLAARWAMSYFTLASFRSWDTILIQFLPESLWNLFRVEDPALTELVTQARNTLDEQEQADLFQQVNAYVVAQAWNAPWSVVKGYFVSNDRVDVQMRSFAPAPWLYDFTPAS